MANPHSTDANGNAKPTGKQRASRIRLDHYKIWDGPTRLKWVLSAIATAAVLTLVLWTFVSPRGMAAVAHGPVSQSHALWESQCDACHTPGNPLRSDALSLTQGLPGNDQQRCQTCHQVAAHPGRAPDHDQACAACHQEHRGANIDLTQVADAACVACHRDLTQVAKRGETKSVATVGQFPDDHPDFSSLPDDLTAGDPGTLKFSHSRHMRLGLTTSEGSKQSEQRTYAMLHEAERANYLPEGQDPNQPIQLDCASCHQLQTGGEGSTATLAAADRGVYLPVTYAQHCQACHPLSTLPVAQGLQSAAEAVPHGLSPVEIDRFLTRKLRSDWFETDDPALQDKLRRPVPGRSEILSAPEVESALNLLNDAKENAKQDLARSCQQCHAQGDELLAVQPVNVPNVWLPKAKFDHTAHRMMQCSECHPAASKKDSELSLVERGEESREVMIPGKQNCAQCHAPQGRDIAGKPQGGVRHDCALCHRYHAGELSAPSLPSSADGNARFSLEQFFQGAGNAPPAN